MKFLKVYKNFLIEENSRKMTIGNPAKAALNLLIMSQKESKTTLTGQNMVSLKICLETGYLTRRRPAPFHLPLPLRQIKKKRIWMTIRPF